MDYKTNSLAYPLQDKRGCKRYFSSKVNYLTGFQPSSPERTVLIA